MKFVIGRVSVVMVLMLAGVPSVGLAQQTGTLVGVVKDAQGAVLPGVTVTAASDALIGGSRSVATGDSGAFQLTGLPPGTYILTYELTGFTSVKREGVAIQVSQTVRMDVDMAVGSLQETVTVSGASPVVDVSSTVTQTNITKELYEAIPSGRNPWVMAGLVPGVITGRLDVGGTEGMQQYNLEAFGSADSQKSFSIDGLKTNWGGGSGGATMQYYGFEMYEEYNMQTASGTAESDVSGVYMNMVTKSGGNRLTSDHNFYFMNDGLQTTNIDDELRGRLGLRPGQQSGAAGNPIKISYDWSSTLGGPIARDKAWFFGALRWWRLDQFQIGALNPDGSQGIDDNRIRNFMGKGTYQLNQQTRRSVMFNRNLKDRFHRREVDFSEDKATVLQDQPAQNYVAHVSTVFGRATVFDARIGRMWGEFPTRYQKEVEPTDIAIRDIVRDTQVNAAIGQSINPNHRYQANANLGFFREDMGPGTHDMKAGVQLSWERMGYDRIRNGDHYLELSDGAPSRVHIANTPVNSDHRLETWGLFVQDRWTAGRATLNYGVRFDGVSSYLPEQSSPAGTFVGERSFPRKEVFKYGFNAAPRLGLSYDLFGNGRAALKAYYGRFYNQFGSELAETLNLNGLQSVPVTWNDLNSNLRLDAGEFTAPNFGSVVPRMNQDAKRPYSDEMNVGVDYQLLPNFAVGASYHRRQHRNGLGIVDEARPSSAYTPVERTYLDPVSLATQTITVYNLNPALASVRDRVITNVDVLRSDYDGVQFTFNKRMSNRWQVLGGLTLQTHQGFSHSGTYTNPGNTTDFNDPTYRLNRDNSSVFIELPWSFTLSGSYLVAYGISVSGKYTARAGDPLIRTFQAAGLAQGTQTVWVQPRGEDRTETVNKFVDLRFSKRFGVGRSRLEGTVDLFNLLNANHVLEQNTATGTTWGRPSRLLAPRIVRFGLTARF
ncbi:MAG: carboxypeptidase regulatory-like domain-containing protein [Acidobacteria bacterium]|nr:carboxypeptidase regulatory-like domain-containing protein [Acidobacteriota bacterium]